MNAPHRFRSPVARFASRVGGLVLLVMSASCLWAQSFAWLESPKRGRRLLIDLDSQRFRRSLKPNEYQRTPVIPAWFPPPDGVALVNERDPNLIPQGEVHGVYMTQLTVPETRSFYDRVLYEKRCSQSFWQLEEVPGSKKLNSRGPHFKFCTMPQAEVRVSFRPESGGTRVYLTYKTRVAKPAGTLRIVAYDDDTTTVVVEDAQNGTQFRANAFLLDVCGQTYGGLSAAECRITQTRRRR